ncbi:hypothetical protein [Candidatus Nitrotoga fabula]|uniref:Uncharacterized protein n=1 Tax=Candidatus Nitrotoga fabula TaxID=2182327 RepID=A0A916BAQ1_9PROT|nr:hypothetical protein [Candidatus Nitrotoga fabula]CAE6692811.1 membrane hypothetical protein [Candidatus Nitrotoga fabula]
MLDDIKKVLPLLTVWSPVSALIYILAYWCSFDINPLIYISLSDLLSYGGYSSVVAFCIILSCAVVEFLSPKKREIEKGHEKIILKLALFWFFIGGVVSLYFGLKYPLAVVGYFLSLIPIGNILSSSKFMKEQFKTAALRYAVCLLLFPSPALILFLALSEAHNINEKSSYMAVTIENVTGMKNGEYIFLGKLGDSLFVLPENGTGFIELNRSVVPVLRYKKFNK